MRFIFFWCSLRDWRIRQSACVAAFPIFFSFHILFFKPSDWFITTSFRLRSFTLPVHHERTCVARWYRTTDRFSKKAALQPRAATDYVVPSIFVEFFYFHIPFGILPLHGAMIVRLWVMWDANRTVISSGQIWPALVSSGYTKLVYVELWKVLGKPWLIFESRNNFWQNWLNFNSKNNGLEICACVAAQHK